MKIEPITLTIEHRDKKQQQEFPIGSVACARFCSRDLKTTRKELDAMIDTEGRFSAACLTNPSIGRIARYLLTQDRRIEVQGALTGAEAEVVIVRNGKDVFITVGSDQCDREIDGLFPDKPKQMCPHPIARIAWPYKEVHDHWDSLRVYSEITCEGHAVVLQDASVSELVDCEYLLAMDTVRSLPDTMFLFGGSTEFSHTLEDEVARLKLPKMVCHGVGDSCSIQLIDPVLDRTIAFQFSAVPVGDDYDERKERQDRGEMRAPHH